VPSTPCNAPAWWPPGTWTRINVCACRSLSARVPVAEDINGDGRYDAVRKSFHQVFLPHQISYGGTHGPAH